MAGSATSKRTADNGSPKNRRSSASTTSTTRERQAPNDADAKPRNESPLKRVKHAIEQDANKKVIGTADELKEFIADHDPSGRGVPASTSAKIVLRMRVVWTSFETCSTGSVARLHLIDNHVDETVEEMQSLMKDEYTTKKAIVDNELVTASLYGVEEGDANIPADGAIVRISKMWSVKMFAKHSCQLSTSLDYVKAEL